MRTISKNINLRILNLAFVAMLALLLLPISYSQVTDMSDVTASLSDNPTQEHSATQLPAEAGLPVQWVKKVDIQNLYDQAISELTVIIPDDAYGFDVKNADTGSAVAFRKEQSELIITDSIGFNEFRSYIIKYSTQAPDVQETTVVTKGDTLVKSVIVSSVNHYEDVLTYTDIPEVPGAQDTIRLYWYVDGVKTDVTTDVGFDVKFYDTDGNGVSDRMSWVAPHLSTQIFEIVIFSDMNTPVGQSGINIDLLEPAGGAYITSTSKVNFNYSVSYNASTTVFCNLTVDGTVERENIPTAADTEITTYFNLSSGSHDWYVHCAGDDGTTNTSETRTFTIDLDTPTITLGTPDYHVSYSDSIDLNFTPVDIKYPVLVCSMSVNGALNRTGIIASNNTLQTVALSGLSNGVYDWNVSCEDAAGNTGLSEERVFYISSGTPSEYNISSNKGTYGVGETGYLVIDGKAGSNLTLFIDPPRHDSSFKHFTSPGYPMVEMINYTDSPGTYNVDAIFSHGGEVYIVKTSFDVTSSFHTNIEINESDGEPGSVFTFEAISSGGIGNVTYEWDFDDDSTASGEDVDHTYTSVGEYTVELTATDSRGNTVTDTKQVNVYNRHDVQLIVKELQTKKLLENITVEIDDERKKTGADGTVNFSVYEGKRRIYVAHTGYEWVKQVRNITEDLTITIELNNTAITNYTPIDEEAEQAIATQQDEANSKAEELLAKISAALEDLDTSDDATKAVLDTLDVKKDLELKKKEIRQIIRDIGNAELDTELSNEEKEEKIANITSRLAGFDTLITAVDVKETTEFVDYPKKSDISMLSSEYLRYKKLEYSTGKKEDYIEQNVKLQEDIGISTRLSIVELELITGSKKNIALVINKITKSPVDTDNLVILEYLPKEVAKSASEVEMITDFKVVKADPILEFDASLDSYSYYIANIDDMLSLEQLQKTKHVLMQVPADSEDKGLVGVTGFSFLPSLKIKNPKLAMEIVLILILLCAYLVYHFDLIDKVKEYRGGKTESQAPYQTDMAYKPESTFDAVTRKVTGFVKKEDELLKKELSHIKTLIMSAHTHAETNNHNHADDTYKQIMGVYKTLSTDAKSEIHPETKQVYNKILLSRVNSLINEANVHLQNRNHAQAESHYSEIKGLYPKLEQKHRASVSERCIELHQKLFENSLT